MASPQLAPLSNAPVTPPPNGDKLRGILCMTAGMFLFAAVDAQGKLLTETLHPVQIVWTRQLGLLVGVILMIGLRGTKILRSANPRLQIARGTAAAFSATLFIVAVSYVPLADAVAVSFVAPFMVTLLGAFVLREQVGMRRWIAVAIGFVGMLIVVRPGLGVLHPAVLLVLVAASLFSLRQILSRMLSGADTTATTVAYTAITSSLLLTLPLPFVWITPVWGTQLALLVSVAIMAAFAEILVIRSLELAQAVVLAPIHYSILIWATFYGWLIFDQLPDMWTAIGASIIIATGAYTLHRERLAKGA